ncbi:MAG: PPOX class F420-dependent oxidoreductase [Chloroflexota bacterium]|nr:PPOX class F420-dependent oxidoreductase [Chloroflexota bacterium]
MSNFTENELSYLLGERRLARLATVGPDGMPHLTVVGWSHNAELDTIDVGGRDFAATKKFRDVRRTGVAAIVIDDVLPPWQPRGVEVRGRAEALADPSPLIRIHPTRIVSWGIENGELGSRHARSVEALGVSGE